MRVACTVVPHTSACPPRLHLSGRRFYTMPRARTHCQCPICCCILARESPSQNRFSRISHDWLNDLRWLYGLVALEFHFTHVGSTGEPVFPGCGASPGFALTLFCNNRASNPNVFTFISGMPGMDRVPYKPPPLVHPRLLDPPGVIVWKYKKSTFWPVKLSHTMLPHKL